MFEQLNSGGVAERLKAAVLKTDRSQCFDRESMTYAAYKREFSHYFPSFGSGRHDFGHPFGHLWEFWTPLGCCDLRRPPLAQKFPASFSASIVKIPRVASYGI